MPLMIIITILGTPCFMINIFSNCRHRKFHCCIYVLFGFFIWIFYVFIPFIFLFVSIPLICFYTLKVCVEFSDLLKNKCKFYRKVNVSPGVEKYFRCIRMSRR